MHSLRRTFAAVALALLIAPLVANSPLFDPDEGLHAAIAQEMVRRADYVTPTFLGEPFLDKPILFFWAEAASLRLFGDTEFAVRVPPLLFGLAGMLSVALLGGALFGASAGLTAGIAYGTMLVPLAVSQVAVHDIGVIPFMCVACWCLARIAAGHKAAALAVLAGVALGLSILTKGLVGCVFAAIFAACLGPRYRARIPMLFLALAVAGVIAILVALPWYLAMERAHPGYLHYYFIERHLQGYLTATQRHSGRPWWYYIPIVFGGTLPWTMYLLTGARGWRQHAARPAVLAWFAVGLVFLSAGESKLVTYALPLFPALALLVGDIVSRPGGASAGAHRASLIVAGACLAGIPAAGLLALRARYGESVPALWLPTVLCAAGTLYAISRAARAVEPATRTSWIASGAIVSLVAMMVAIRPAAAWLSARDLATAINATGRLPPRVSVVDERIGSLVFYLDPALRAQADGDRLVETSFSEALTRVRADPDDAIVAVRTSQMDRFKRLFPGLPEADRRAGTFAMFRAGTLKNALPR